MGWWSADVMGGDTPLDIVAEIARTCDLEYHPENAFGVLGDYAFTKELLEKKTDAIFKLLNSGKFYCDEIDVGMQVFGVILMSVGADISDELKIRITRAARNDTWAVEGDKERQDYMNKFANSLEQYNGEPTEYRTTTLFQKFQEMGKLEIVKVP